MYLFIIIATFIFDYGVQLAYYLYCTGKDPRAFRGQKTLLHYYTGWLGDGIIAPLINILMFYVIVNIGHKPTLNELMAAFGVALVLDFCTHYIQGKTKMTNWSMPKPFQWNFAGKWHMISFPVQISYLLLFLWLLAHNGVGIFGHWTLVAATVGVFALMATFLVLYHFDNRPRQTPSKILR